MKKLSKGTSILLISACTSATLIGGVITGVLIKKKQSTNEVQNQNRKIDEIVQIQRATKKDLYLNLMRLHAAINNSPNIVT